MNQLKRAAFSECVDTPDDLSAEGDKVMLRWTTPGTQLGEWVRLLGSISPIGKPVTFASIHSFRIADGKFVERWAKVDMLGILQQVDALPAR